MMISTRAFHRSGLRFAWAPFSILAIASVQTLAAARAQAPTGVITEVSSGSSNLISPTPLSTFVSNLNLSTMTFTAAGGTTARSLAALGADVVNIASYGAIGDMTILGYTGYTIGASSTSLSATAGVFNSGMVGKTIVLPGAGASGAGLVSVISGFTDTQHVTLATAASTALASVTETPEIGTDDTTAINNAIAAAKARVVAQGGSQYNVGTVNFPDGTYMVRTLNFANFSSSSLRIMGQGVVWGVGAGQPVVDMLGSRWMRWSGVSILGDQYAVPSVGLQLGRIGNTATNSSDNNAFDHFLISGYFSTAALLNEQSETTEFDKIHFYNNYAGGYAVIQDGYNHFKASSPYVTNNEPTDTPESFDENVFVNCIFGAYAPFWLGNTSRMTVIGGYLVAGGPYGITLYGEPGGDNIQLNLDMHMETPSGSTGMTDAFFVTGTNTAPYLEGLRWREHGNEASNSMFKVDASSSVGHVTMPNADIDIRSFAGGATKLFDNPTPWTLVTGQIFVSAASQMNLSTFSGLLSTPTGMTDLTTIPSASVQNVLSSDGIGFAGTVSSVAVSNGGVYYAVTGSRYTPTVTIGAAPSGGTTAAGHVSALVLNGEGSLGATGTGYAVANNVPVKDANGNVMFTVNITAVGTGGAISSLTYNVASPPTIVTSVPALPLSIVQSGGSGGTITGTNFAISAVAIDTAGAGYTTAPSVTFSSTNAAPAGTGVALLPLQISEPTRLAAMPITTETGSYSVAASDCGSTVEYTGTANVTWTVPAGLATGCEIDVVQKSTGAVTFAGASGVTAAEYVTSGSKTYTTDGASSKAQVLIDSTTTFLLSGQVN